MAKDARLVTAALIGDRRAFERIVRRYQSLVCAVTYSATGDLSASEDLAQETFLNAWKGLAGLHEPSRLRPWLCTIARNLSTDWLRRRRRDVVAEAVPLDEAGQVEASAQSPHERAAASERGALVRGALSEMPEAYRMPLVLYYREQQSVRRVAQSLELSEDAVRQRLTRGRGMLKERMTSLVEETLTATRPGDAFCVAAMAAVAGVAAKKAVAGTTVLGLSLAKAAAIGAIAVGAVVGGGVALQNLGAGGQAAAIAAEAPKPEPAPPAPQPAVVYAERVPRQAVVLLEADLKPYLAMMSEVMGGLGAAGAPPALDALVSNTCLTRDPTAVDLGHPWWGVSRTPGHLEPGTTLFRVTDAKRYLASLKAELRKDGEEGDLQVYTHTGTKQALLVDTVGRWAAVSSDLAEARVVMQMVKAGEFPAQRVFPDAAIGVAYRLRGLPEALWVRPDSPLNALRRMVGISAGAKPAPGSWGALIDTAEGLASRQAETVAFALIPEGTDGFSVRAQLQPVAGTPLAGRLAAKRPGGLSLLKYVPADSLAVLDSQLPDLSGLLPAQDPVPLGVRALRQLGDEAALALGRSPKGSAQIVLAARVKDANAAAALANDVAALLIPYLANLRPDQPDLPFRLNRSEVRHNGHVVKVWDFDPNPPPPGARPSTLLTLLGEDLKLYEFTVDDTLILAFGDGMFEKVKQMLDGNLADLGHAARFTEAMAAMPAQPNAACYVEVEKLAAWALDVAPGPPQLKVLKFQEGPPALLACHVIGRDVLEAAVRLPAGAVRAFVEIQKAMLSASRAVPPPPPAAPPPQALPPKAPPAPLAPLHAAALAGNRAEVERLLAAGVDVNLVAPDKRTSLHYAAEQGRLEIVQLLLEKGANANAEDARRRMPLHLAAEGGHREVAEALLKAGAEVNSTDLDGWTPTGYAVRAGHRDLADLLVRSGGVE